MNKDLQDRAMFVSFCIEQYAKAHHISAEEAAEIMQEYGITAHFYEFYDVLHTQGGQWLAPWLAEDMGISITDAINLIYKSKLYKKLSTESTKYWHLGPVDLYRELLAENK